jgi:hypothetical protein
MIKTFVGFSNDWKTGVEKVPMIGTFGDGFFQ